MQTNQQIRIPALENSIHHLTDCYARGNFLGETIDLPLEKLKKHRRYVAAVYKNEQMEPMVMSYSQTVIYTSIVERVTNKLQIITPTQYGKSEVLSLAILERVSNYPEEWIIVAPSGAQSKIIIRKLRKHIAENPSIVQQLFGREKKEKVQKMLEKTSEEEMAFPIQGGGMGRVRVITSDARSASRGTAPLMGHGCPNVVCDESAILSNNQESGVFRMFGGHKDHMYVKIGNPFSRNHFWESWRDKNFKKVFVDGRCAVEEGRITKEQYEQGRIKPNGDVLYECKFPDEDSVDMDNYRRIVVRGDIENAMEEFPINKKLPRVYGLDVGAGGKDPSALVRRDSFGLRIIGVFSEKRATDLLDIVYKLIMEDGGFDASFTVVTDSVGVGWGVVSQLSEKFGMLDITHAFSGGKLARKPDRFANRRSECYWELAREIEKGLKLYGTDDRWYEISDNWYKEQGDRRIKLKPKEEMKRMGIDSPNVADAASMTFDVAIPEVELTDDFFIGNSVQYRYDELARTAL